MNTWMHGGDWAGFAEDYGQEPLDFSANVSPLGLPPGVAAALKDAVVAAERYPDPHCRALRERLSETEGVPASQILCGNGAADLIYRAALAAKPKRALVTAPAFGEYENALAVTGCAVTRYALRDALDFRLDEGILEQLTPGIDMIFLCQPNNPTGLTISRSLLMQILERCAEHGTRLVLDECFCDFLDDPASGSLKDQLDDYPNLLILRAFTKLYAMAGVRLGYALCAESAFLQAMEQAGPPWAVSGLAQQAGLAALEEKSYVNQLRTLIAAERSWLAGELKHLGLRVLSGEANFLLFRSETPLLEPLARRGLLLRGCGKFSGLDESWYRTAVRTHADNLRLIGALKEILP